MQDPQRDLVVQKSYRSRPNHTMLDNMYIQYIPDMLLK